MYGGIVYSLCCMARVTAPWMEADRASKSRAAVRSTEVCCCWSLTIGGVGLLLLLSNRGWPHHTLLICSARWAKGVCYAIRLSGEDALLCIRYTGPVVGHGRR